jgi:hypothetical protein
VSDTTKAARELMFVKKTIKRGPDLYFPQAVAASIKRQKAKNKGSKLLPLFFAFL